MTLAERTIEIYDRLTAKPFILRDLYEPGPYEGQTPVTMTEREAHNRNSELRGLQSPMRWKAAL